MLGKSRKSWILFIHLFIYCFQTHIICEIDMKYFNVLFSLLWDPKNI